MTVLQLRRSDCQAAPELYLMQSPHFLLIFPLGRRQRRFAAAP